MAQSRFRIWGNNLHLLMDGAIKPHWRLGCDKGWKEFEGNESSEEAKIGGMVPAVFTLSGKCASCPP